jgi:NAD(P)-dependent dehydrogenase (short-subunit alcohol dehydrogenase family)
VSRKADACEQVRAEFETQGYEVLAQPCNVSRKDELQALVDAALKRWGRVDVAVSNAATKEGRWAAWI